MESSNSNPNSRIQLLCNQLAGPKEIPQPVLSSVDFCFFDDLLTPEEVKIRKQVREFAEKEIAPIISDYYDRAEFPESLIEKMGEQPWMRLAAKKPIGDGGNDLAIALTILELARVDASICTFVQVQTGLCLWTVESFGSEEQKKKWMPDIMTYKLLCGWGLTEPLVGSAAILLETAVTKTDDGYVLNGEKRWIGNANRDMILTWARNTETSKIECYAVPTKAPGVKVEVIKNKLSLRALNNCHITFTDAKIPLENKLPGAKGFGSTNAILERTRMYVAWTASGIALGVYDNTIKYINNRNQFGAKISSFQLTQEKLARMMGHIQAMLLMAWRVTRLAEAKKLTIGIAAMSKAWTTKLLREVAQLGREMMGGNGILIDNYAMKALADAEALYTYEGTYDINSLVLGRELTGVPAFF